MGLFPLGFEEIGLDMLTGRCISSTVLVYLVHSRWFLHT